MTRSIRRLALGIMVSLAAASASRAANKTWTDAVSGDFADPVRWTGGVPVATDTATFNLPGTYTVTFDNNPNALTTPVNNQDLFFSAGTVTFTSGSGGPYTYRLTGAGGDDAVITGGALTLGTSGNPLHLTVDDDLRLRGGATMTAEFGSDITTADLFLGDSTAPTGNGTLLVDGVGSTLTMSGQTQLGTGGQIGTLTMRNGATADFNGVLGLADGSSSHFSTGVLNVESGATITSANIRISPNSTNGQTGTFTVGNGVGTSTVTQDANATLVVGGNPTTGPDPNSGTLNINSGGVFYSGNGTGTITINPTGTVNVAGGGTLNANGNVAVNTAGGVGAGAVINVNGSGSAFTQSQLGATTLTVGHAATGTAAINIGTIANGGALTTGTGMFTINATGTVNVGNGDNTGTLNANGNVTIDGGLLTRGSGSAFNLADGKTMTIQNAGRARFTSDYTTATDASYNITGTSAKLETLSGGALNLDSGAQVNVTSGGSVASATSIDILASSLGQGVFLTIDGSGSSAIADGNSLSNWGNNYLGSTAEFSVTFRNGATGSFGAIDIMSYKLNTFDVASGADVTCDNLTVIAFESETLLSVQGSGSTLTLNPGSSLTLGDRFGSSELVEFSVFPGGLLTVGTGGSTTLYNGGNITMQGGTADLKTLTVNNGTIIFNSGSLSYIGNLTVGDTGFLGSNLTLDSSRQLTLSGTTKVDAARTLTLSGGTLNTGSLVKNGTFNFASGTLGITGAAGLTIGPNLLGNNFSLGSSHSLNVTNTTTIPAGTSLALDGGALTTGNLVVDGAFDFNSGALSVTGAGGLAIGAGGPIGATLVIDTFRALHVTNTVTLSAGSHLVVPIGSGFSAGQIVNDGDLVVIDTAIDSPVANNNAITVVGTVDFNGLISGPGDFFGPGTANFNGGMAPGASPAEVAFEGSVTLTDTNTLFIEIGGTTLGTDYDRLTITGDAVLDGILNVSLINGFTPLVGQQFTILTAGSIVDSGFMLAGSAASSFNLLVSSTSVILQTIGFAGDYNHNGRVDTADYTVWRDAVGTSGPGLAADGDGDGTVDDDDYLVWKNHFGQTPPGSGALANRAVPEPPAMVTLFLGMLAQFFRPTVGRFPSQIKIRAEVR